MMQRTLVLMLCVVLSGCATSLMSQVPIHRSVTLTGPPAMAYAKAMRAMATMGSEFTQMQPEAGFLQGKVHGAVLLTVTLVTVSQGIQVDVSGSLLPGKLVVGAFSEVDDYVALLQHGEQHADHTP